MGITVTFADGTMVQTTLEELRRLLESNGG